MISRASKVVEVHVPGVYFSSSRHKPLARRASDVSLAPWSHASAGAVPSEPDTQMRPSLSSSITKRLFEKSSIGGISSVNSRDGCETVPHRPHGCRMGLYQRFDSATQTWWSSSCPRYASRRQCHLLYR